MRSVAALSCGMRVLHALRYTTPAAVRRLSADALPPVVVRGMALQRDAVTNVTPAILERTERRLLQQRSHPLRILKNEIEAYFQTDAFRVRGRPIFSCHDDVSPVVTPHQNFDSLLIPEDHPSRSRSDNYFINSATMLRAHTSAHQADFIRQGLDAFLFAGDVYRRDEVDRSHYPVFHQMEGVRLFTEAELEERIGGPAFSGATGPDPELEARQTPHTMASAVYVADDLKHSLSGLVAHLFGEVEQRWVSTYFPFTHPSWELEIMFEGEWLEVLGCGIMRQEIINAAGAQGSMGWAFGLGLERLAMILFSIPDIRLFWSEDERFLKQFDEGRPLRSMRFAPFSKHPPCYKDITFWIPPGFSPNTFADLVRSVAGDLAEQVSLVDKFTHPKTQRESQCYRITYRSMDRTFTNDEVNLIQEELRRQAAAQGLELR